MKKVRDYMKSKVVSFKPGDTIFQVAKVFSHKGISGAPVLKGGKVVGVVSEADLIKHLETRVHNTQSFEGHTELHIGLMLIDILRENFEFTHEVARLSKTRLKDVMSKNIISISPEDGLVEAAELMGKHDVHRLPVIDGGKLVGIISRADLIKALVD